MSVFLTSFRIVFRGIKNRTIFASANDKPFMLIIEVKETESIDRALKKYKRKFERAGVLKELRRRKQFTKPSVIKRNVMLKAEYKQKTYGT